LTANTENWRSRAAGARWLAPNIFQPVWLALFGGAVAFVFLIWFAALYRHGRWVVDPAGLPIYTDFGCGWTAGLQALNGSAAALYDPAQFIKIQAALFRPSDFFYPNWPYPPTFLLILAPLALLPYRYAFLLWDVATLAAAVAAVYLIVRRKPAIAVALASPFTIWNFLAAQNGFLTAALLGGGLALLPRRPALAGTLIGVLTYKPQFGLLLPIALIAAGEWRAIAAALATLACLFIISAFAFGIGAWIAFPQQLLAQSGLNFAAGEDGDWGYLQSLYGLVRLLHGGALLGALAQGVASAGLVLLVWRLWRSPARYPLKAAALSAAALLASPYAFAYDMAALMIPAAFLAADQLRHGVLPGEKAFWIAVFGLPLALLLALGDSVGGPTFGGAPAGLFAALALFLAALRRAWADPAIAATTEAAA
jgi:alpha-1,2-mannosyltransferase